jgi:hypothetical protein
MLKLEWTDGLQIRGNRIAHAYSQPLKKPGEVIHLAHVRHVSLEGNSFEDAGASFGKLIAGEDVNDPNLAGLKSIQTK